MGDLRKYLPFSGKRTVSSLGLRETLDGRGGPASRPSEGGPAEIINNPIDPTRDTERTWQRRSVDQVLRAAQRLEEYPVEGRREIRAQLLRRCVATSDLGMHVYLVESPTEGREIIVSVLPQEIAFAHGLVPQAVVGKLLKPSAEGGTLSPENFALNTRFADFLHDVIGRHGPDTPSPITAAKRLDGGRVYVIDGRTRTPSGTVPPQDILGAFRVEAGVAVRQSYERNRNHVIFSDHGFPKLDEFLQEWLVAELAMQMRGRARGPADER